MFRQAHLSVQNFVDRLAIDLPRQRELKPYRVFRQHLMAALLIDRTGPSKIPTKIRNLAFYDSSAAEVLASDIIAATIAV